MLAVAHFTGLTDMIDRYIAEHLPKLAKTNAGDQVSMLKKMVEPAWGNRLVTEITKSDVARFLDFVAEGRPRPCKAKPNNRARKLQGHKPTPIRANRMLGLTEVPVIRLSHLDDAERRAYRIADNKLTELGEWDEALLRDEIAGLLAEDFDLTLLGISDDDLDALLRVPEALGGDGPVEGEDDVFEVPVTPVSVPGDLWQLGAHRLICGDSTAADVVERLLGDVRPLLMITDPPYGVEYDPSWRNQAGAAKTKRTGVMRHQYLQ